MHLEETLCVRIGEGREVQGEWLREGGREGGREKERKERASERGRKGRGGDEPAREIHRRRKKISLRTDYTRWSACETAVRQAPPSFLDAPPPPPARA